MWYFLTQYEVYFFGKFLNIQTKNLKCCAAEKCLKYLLPTGIECRNTSKGH